MRILTTAAAVAVAATAALAADDDHAIELPADWRDSYVMYLEADRTGSDKQIIRYWADPASVEAARAGEELPYGSILVGELIGAQLNEDETPILSALDRRISTGETLALIVMERVEGNDEKWDDGLEVGDWAFDAFAPDGTNRGADSTACRECHAARGPEFEYQWGYEHLALAPF